MDKSSYRTSFYTEMLRKTDRRLISQEGISFQSNVNVVDARSQGRHVSGEHQGRPHVELRISLSFIQTREMMTRTMGNEKTRE